MTYPITVHISLDIQAALKRSTQSLDGILTTDGRDLTGSEVKVFLAKQRSEHGFTHYSGCDNMNEFGRCAGHPVVSDGDS